MLAWLVALVAAQAPVDPAPLLSKFREEFIRIVPGKGEFPASFSMGSAAGEPAEAPVHKVTLKYEFHVAKYEVPQNLWVWIMGSNPSRWKGARNSVENMDFEQCIEFCRRATDAMRKARMIDANQVVRLPSEAEWEYVARAGTSTRYSFGDDAKELGDYAWHTGNAEGNDPPVGAKKPNAWNLYDVHGYLWEWCADSWHDSYAGAPADGSAWIAEGSTQGVLRGGSWKDKADKLTSSYRRREDHGLKDDAVGLRCVLAEEKAQAGIPDLGTRKAGVDWPCFLGPTHDGKSSEKGLAAWPDGGPKVVWTRPLGESYGTAAVSRGRLFHFDCHAKKASLACLKSETGEEIWKREYAIEYDDMYGYDNGPRCSPVIDDDRVYIFGVEGMLQCLSVSDGAVIWKKNTTEDFNVVQNFFGVGSTPIIEGDLLIAQVGGSPPKTPGIQSGQTKGLDSGVVAFDKRTGQVKYKFSDELASYSSPLVTTIGDRRWGFVFARGGLIGFEPATGKIDFHYPWRAPILESVNASNPVVVDDLVLISECYGVGSSVLRVKPGGYDVIWKDVRRRDYALGTHWNTPIHVDGFVYGSSGRHAQDAELRCIELATGKVRWSLPRLTRCSLMLVDGHFVCLGEDGALRLLKVNPERYEEISKVMLKDGEGRPLLVPPAWAAPILSHGLLYVRGKDRLVCLDLIPQK